MTATSMKTVVVARNEKYMYENILNSGLGSRRINFAGCCSEWSTEVSSGWQKVGMPHMRWLVEGRGPRGALGRRRSRSRVGLGAHRGSGAGFLQVGERCCLNGSWGVRVTKVDTKSGY